MWNLKNGLLFIAIALLCFGLASCAAEELMQEMEAEAPAEAEGGEEAAGEEMEGMEQEEGSEEAESEEEAEE